MRGTLIILTAQTLFDLPFLTEVSHETVARRHLTLASVGSLRPLSLWRGANLALARTTLLELGTCQVALAARCEL